MFSQTDRHPRTDGLRVNAQWTCVGAVCGVCVCVCMCVVCGVCAYVCVCVYVSSRIATHLIDSFAPSR